MNDLRALNDSQLRTRLDECAAFEQRALFDVVRVLAEFEERRTYLKLGYHSSFEYLTKHLQYSEAAATRRIRAARAARAVPEVVGCVESGEVSFSAVETCSELLVETGGKLVLEALKGKTIEEARCIKASAQSKFGQSTRVGRDVVTPIVSFSPVGQKEIEFDNTADFTCNRSGVPVVEETKHRIAFTVGSEFMKKLERVKELKFRGSREDVSLEKLFGDALELMLEKEAPERRTARRDARRSRSEAASEADSKAGITSYDSSERYVPVALRDRVLERDQYRCSFVSSDGRRCGCREDLEFDHRRPVAFGGRTEIGNLRTLCRAHNGHAWEVARAEVFG